jgi:hypothetical protein
MRPIQNRLGVPASKLSCFGRKAQEDDADFDEGSIDEELDQEQRLPPPIVGLPSFVPHHFGGRGLPKTPGFSANTRLSHLQSIASPAINRRRHINNGAPRELSKLCQVADRSRDKDRDQDRDRTPIKRITQLKSLGDAPPQDLADFAQRFVITEAAKDDSDEFKTALSIPEINELGVAEEDDKNQDNASSTAQMNKSQPMVPEQSAVCMTDIEKEQQPNPSEMKKTKKVDKVRAAMKEEL